MAVTGKQDLKCSGEGQFRTFFCTLELTRDGNEDDVKVGESKAGRHSDSRQGLLKAKVSLSLKKFRAWGMMTHGDCLDRN